MKYLSHSIVTTFIFSFACSAFSQILDVSPAFPTSADVVTVVYDASEGNAFWAAVKNLSIWDEVVGSIFVANIW